MTTPTPTYCPSNASHRIHTDTDRLLCCEGCGATWTWSETGDRLPLHEPAATTTGQCRYSHGADRFETLHEIRLAAENGDGREMTYAEMTEYRALEREIVQADATWSRRESEYTIAGEC